MKKQIVQTEKAPAAIGSYSQGIVAGLTVFTSGQLPIHPETGEIPGDIQAQARQSLENLKSVLEAAGSSLDHVLKTTVFIRDMDDFSAIDRVYREYFKVHFPARSCVQVARLPKDSGIEIEATAILSE